MTSVYCISCERPLNLGKSKTPPKDGMCFSCRHGMSEESLAAKDRILFEQWVRLNYKSKWPNPAADGSYQKNGVYYNIGLHDMWCAWQAALAYVR